MGIVLVLVVVAFLVPGIYFMYLKKEEGQSGKKSAPAEVPMSSLVNVKSAVITGRRVTGTFNMDVDDFIGLQSGAPFTVVLDDEYEKEENILGRLRSPDVSEEEKFEIAERLRECGYNVTYPPRQAAPAAGVQSGTGEDDEDESDDAPKVDIAGTTDIGVLNDIITNPYSRMEDIDAARKRLDELKGGVGEPAGQAPAPESPEGADGGHEDYSADPSMFGEFNDEYDAGYVDVDSHVSLDDPHPEVPYEAAAENDGASDVPSVKEDVGADELEQDESATETDAKEDDGADSPEGKVMDFKAAEGFDSESADAAKAVALMTFIAEKFREGLLSPELVAFAEEKLHLRIDDSFWTPESRKHALNRMVLYKRDKTLANMTLDQFELYVTGSVDRKAEVSNDNPSESRETADEESAGKETAGVEAEAVADAPAEEDAEAVTEGSGKENAGESAVSKESVFEEVPRSAGPGKSKNGVAEPSRRSPGTRPVSAFFDTHGGKNDAMWARLEAKDRK